MIQKLNNGRSALARAFDATYRSALGFVDGLYGPHTRCADLALCLISAGWVWALSANPVMMSRPSYAGLSFLTRQVWVGVFAGLAVIHLIGYLNPAARTLRVFSLGVAAWVWIVVGATMTWAVTTGGITYLVVGFFALFAAIHVERRKV